MKAFPRTARIRIHGDHKGECEACSKESVALADIEFEHSRTFDESYRVCWFHQKMAAANVKDFLDDVEDKNVAFFRKRYA